jgi:hypothetical protein
VRVSLILRKLNFAADWQAVGRRCVVDPLCCEEVTQIPLPCGTGCDYTLPSTMYVTFTGQTRIPDGSYAVRLTPLTLELYSRGAVAGSFGVDFALSPNMIWAAGTISLETLALSRGDGGGTITGPRHCLPITPNEFGFPRYLSLYVWPHCAPGGGVFLQVSGWVTVLAPGVGDGFIDGYYPTPPLGSMNPDIVQTVTHGIDCTDLLPWLDAGLFPGTLDITE